MKVFIASAILAMATASSPSYQPVPSYTPVPYHPAPTYKPAPYQPAPTYKPTPYHPAPTYEPAPHHPEPKYKAAPEPFAYNFAVNDRYTGTNFEKKEQSDGQSTKGSYSVALPDGRIQHVNYVADDYGGFNAEVTYEGEARYPEDLASPAYKPAAVHYKPAPKY